VRVSEWTEMGMGYRERIADSADADCGSPAATTVTTVNDA